MRIKDTDRIARWLRRTEYNLEPPIAEDLRIIRELGLRLVELDTVRRQIPAPFCHQEDICDAMEQYRTHWAGLVKIVAGLEECRASCGALLGDREEAEAILKAREG